MRITKDQFIKMIENFSSDVEMGQFFHKSRQWSWRKRKKFKIFFGIEKKKRNKSIIESYDNNIPLKEIGKQFFLSKSQVYRIVKKVKDARKRFAGENLEIPGIKE
jgi:hypothetical protein